MAAVTMRISAFLVACLLIATHVIAQAAPPKAPVHPVTDDYFGSKIVDNYRWMEDRDSPDMQRWMRAQADFTRATLDALPGHSELLKRIAELDSSQPATVAGLQIVAGRYYTLRTPAAAQSAKLYVRDSLKSTDRLLIDPEKIAVDAKTHLSIHGYRPSPDGRFIAYTLSPGGSEEPVLHIFDVQAGRDLTETADRAYGDPPFWRTDSKSFFYSRGQEMHFWMFRTAKYQNARAYLHVLGRSFDEDPPILGRGVSDTTIPMTPNEFTAIITAPNSPYAIAVVSPGPDPRLRVYAAPVDSVRDGKTGWHAVAASYEDQYIDDVDTLHIALAGNFLYWPSRKGAPLGQILRLDLSHADSKPEVVVAQGELPISLVYAGRDAIYWRVSDAAVNAVYRLGLTGKTKPEILRLPYAADVTTVVPDLLSDVTMISASSWLRSPAYLNVDANSGAVAITDLQPSGRFDNPGDLVAEEVKVKSWDGTLIPLSIVHKVGIALDGRNLTVLTGYGAYGISSSPIYIPAFRETYEHGGVVAVAHVRGGGENGESWHKAGFQATKPNTWKDYIACAQYLVDRQYTQPSKLVGFAQSAGGILLGRAIEERPELFAVAIIRVPLTDALRFESTANGQANVPEFGSVKTEAGFKALYAMSPYAHVGDGVKYPAVIIYAGANDPRVDAWLPAKLAARLQAATASGKPVLLRVDYDAGHTGFDETRNQEDADMTDMMSFGLWQTGDPAFQPKTAQASGARP